MERGGIGCALGCTEGNLTGMTETSGDACSLQKEVTTDHCKANIAHMSLHSGNPWRSDFSSLPARPTTNSLLHVLSHSETLGLSRVASRDSSETKDYAAAVVQYTDAAGRSSDAEVCRTLL